MIKVMKIIFTKHAEERIKKRKILKEEIIYSINNPEKTIKRHGKHYFQNKIEIGNIEICCEKTEKHIKVITVYWI